MDVDENLTSRYFLDMSENYLFVKLLSKYKIILQRPSRYFNRRRQDEARTAFRKEYNATCHTNFTLKQMIRKINNIKFRLKEKHNKNLSRGKQLPYSDWEKLFLSMWVGSGITIQNEENRQTTIHERVPDGLVTPSEEKFQLQRPEVIIPQDVELKFEAEDSSFEKAPAFRNSTQDFDHTTRSESENLCNNFIFDTKYEKMTIEELKRSVLIAQLKTLKAQEDAARAKEKLTLYKLSKLQENKDD